MIRLLSTILCKASEDVDWSKRWHEDMRSNSLADVRMFAVIITLILCVLALAVVMLVVAKILEKKNDYGDEDELHMRKAGGFSGSVDARMSVDIASGSVNCMKRFHYEEVTKR
ncbi:MAG: hypothetical protein J5607_06870 [Clostridiales bacterium]|nr:hypothetical protein [Clostridiales bacterium]MBR4819416.1 hypothetical protein [Clostridiales bacterium]